MNEYIRPGGKISAYTQCYERLRSAATGSVGSFSRTGTAVIVSRGVAAWMCVLDQKPLPPKRRTKADGAAAGPGRDEMVQVLVGMINPHMERFQRQVS